MISFRCKKGLRRSLNSFKDSVFLKCNDKLFHDLATIKKFKTVVPMITNFEQVISMPEIVFKTVSCHKIIRQIQVIKAHHAL